MVPEPEELGVKGTGDAHQCNAFLSPPMCQVLSDTGGAGGKTTKTKKGTFYELNTNKGNKNKDLNPSTDHCH